MNNKCSFIAYLFVLLTFFECRKQAEHKVKNEALHVYATPAKERFIFSGIDDNGNLNLFVSIIDTLKFNSLEFWKIKPSGEVISKHIIDSTSSKSYFYEKFEEYGDYALVKLPDGGWSLIYHKFNFSTGVMNSKLCRINKEGELLWSHPPSSLKRTKKNFSGFNFYFRNNYIELFGYESDYTFNGNLYLMGYKYDLNGNFIDTIGLQQDTILPDINVPISQRNLIYGINTCNYIIRTTNGYAATIFNGENKNTGFNAVHLALVLFDKSGKVNHYTPFYFDNPWSSSKYMYSLPYLIPSPEGGVLLAGSQLPTGQMFVMKFSEDGDSLWTRFLTNSFANVSGIINSKEGGYMIYGNSPNSNSGQRGKGYIAKLDIDGNLLWEYHLGGENASNIMDVKELPNGDIACVGYTFSFHGGKDEEDAFLLVLHQNGKTE